MEKFTNITEMIKNQKLINPPENFVSQVMAEVEKAENGFPYKFNRFLFQPLEFSKDIKNIISGQLVSYKQCAFLLFVVGLFYLLSGFLVMWGLNDALQWGNANSWLRIQPYIAVASAILIICMGFIILYKPQTVIFAKYGIIIHTAFIVVNACVLEFILFSPQALVFTLILTTAAMVFGVLLISSIRNFLKFGLSTTGSDCAQNT